MLQRNDCWFYTYISLVLKPNTLEIIRLNLFSADLISENREQSAGGPDGKASKNTCSSDLYQAFSLVEFVSNKGQCICKYVTSDLLENLDQSAHFRSYQPTNSKRRLTTSVGGSCSHRIAAAKRLREQRALRMNALKRQRGWGSRCVWRSKALAGPNELTRELLDKSLLWY
jgi:hypothetical protein